MGAAFLAFLGNVFAKIKGWMVAAGAILIALWYAFARGKSNAEERAELNERASRAGRNEKAAEDVSAATKERSDVEAEIARRPTSDNRERLRERWTINDEDSTS